MKISKLHFVAAISAAVWTSGCATHSQNAHFALEQFRSGQSDAAIQRCDRGHNGRSRQLFRVESARLKMLDGRFVDSRKDFEKAIGEVAELEEGAVIRLRDVGTSTLASTIIDDTIRPYFLAGYELVMAFQEQALNDIFLGDLDAAAVEARRAVFAQDLIAKKNKKEIEEARKKISSGEYAENYDAANASYAAMAPALARTANSFQNAYAWYLAGLIYESNNDRPNAYISYKKAWELMPGNTFLQRDVIRLSKSENSEEHEDFVSKYPGAAASVANGTAECIVLLEEGLISERQSVKIPLVISGTITTVMFPVYDDPPYSPHDFDVRIDAASAGRCEVVSYLQSLAYHDLMEKMPGTIVRNVTRGVARGVAYNQAQHNNDSTVQFVGFLANFIQAIADEADTRAWYSLPMDVQIFRAPVQPGDHRVEIVNMANGQSVKADMHVEKGERKLVWLSDIGGRASACVSTLTKMTGGNATIFAKLDSIIAPGYHAGFATDSVSNGWASVSSLEMAATNAPAAVVPRRP